MNEETVRHLWSHNRSVIRDLYNRLVNMREHASSMLDTLDQANTYNSVYSQSPEVFECITKGLQDIVDLSNTKS